MLEELIVYGLIMLHRRIEKTEEITYSLIGQCSPLHYGLYFTDLHLFSFLPRIKHFFQKARQWNFQKAPAYLIRHLEQHPVASGEVHTVDFLWNTLLHRLQTRRIVLMN